MNRMGNSNAMKHGPYKENVFLSQITLNTFGANNNELFFIHSVQTVSFMGQILIGNKLCFRGPFLAVKMSFQCYWQISMKTWLAFSQRGKSIVQAFLIPNIFHNSTNYLSHDQIN